MLVHTHTHCTHGDYKPGCGQLSWFHYVKAESLECITVDNDMMIRGFRGMGICASRVTPSYGR